MSFVVRLSGNRPPEGGALRPPLGGKGKRKPFPDPGASPGTGGLKPARGPDGRPGLPSGLGVVETFDPGEGLGLGDKNASLVDCMGTPDTCFASRSQYTLPIHSK
jgi:hypothetical protein